MALGIIALSGCEEEGYSSYLIINDFDYGTAYASAYEGNTGDSATITVIPQDVNYRVRSIYQNDIVGLSHVTGDHYTFSFTFLSGKNTIDITMYYEELGVSASDIIGPTNELVNYDDDAYMTDDVDDIPVYGEEQITYENPYYLYFKDSSWWNSGAAGVNVLTYDEDMNLLNGTMGSAMTWLSYNTAGQFNYFRSILDGDTVAYVQFIRTDGDNSTYWGARTDILPLPTSPNNMYVLSDDTAWYDESTGTLNYATATESIYDTSNDPVYEGNGTYTVYLEAPSWWTDMGSDTCIYIWGIEQNASWPGELMDLYGTTDEYTIYKFEVDTLNNGSSLIFNVNNGGYQTADLALPTDEYGSDASVIATLPDTMGNSTSVTVTWRENSGTYA